MNAGYHITLLAGEKERPLWRGDKNRSRSNDDEMFEEIFPILNIDV